MTNIYRTVLVPHTQHQMFELVNNVADYPRFLPWCRKSHIIMQNEKEVQATLEIAWSGIHKTFSTHNQLHPYERIDIKLLEGPLHSLEGHWGFMPLGQEGCKVSLNLEFEAGVSLMNKLVEPIFYHMANSLVDAFCKRAAEVYGYEKN